MSAETIGMLLVGLTLWAMIIASYVITLAIPVGVIYGIYRLIKKLRKSKRRKNGK